MKKNWKKILALVLAASVIFCDSSLVYAAQTMQVEETENITYTETYINTQKRLLVEDIKIHRM